MSSELNPLPDNTSVSSRVVRVLAHVDTELARTDIRHVYLDGAEVLRPDLAHPSLTAGAEAM